MKVHISCLIDCDPKFVIQAYNWALSLKETGTTATPFICSVEGAISDAQAQTFESIGVHVSDVKRFGERHAAYCNKISQLFVDEVIDCDWLILSDADIGFLAPPERMIDGAPLRAKPVDLPSPSANAIDEWLRKIGLSWFGDAEASFPRLSEPTQRLTLAHNYNGGIYAMRHDCIREFRKTWADYARSLLSVASPEAKSSVHADQIAFACTVRELGLHVSELGLCWNFPVHLDARHYAALKERPELLALHYHKRMDNHGVPETIGVRWIDEAIIELRNRIVTGRQDKFDNEIFWNYRYRYFPQLGSGLGSRGTALAEKKKITAPAFAEMAGCSVIDVGCGDLEFVRNESFGDYLGLDVSEQAISTAKAKQPTWSFRTDRIETIEDNSFDFALCMDVLIHQPNTRAAVALVDELIRVARKGIVLSIHANQKTNSGISFNTFTLRNYIAKHPGAHAVSALGTFRDVEVFAISTSKDVLRFDPNQSHCTKQSLV